MRSPSHIALAWRAISSHPRASPAVGLEHGPVLEQPRRAPRGRGRRTRPRAVSRAPPVSVLLRLIADDRRAAARRVSLPETWYSHGASAAVDSAGGLVREGAGARPGGGARGSRVSISSSFWDEVRDAVGPVVPHAWRRAGSRSTRPRSSSRATTTTARSRSSRRDWLAHEYYEDDAHKMADVARSERGVSTLHEATGGDPSRSPALGALHAPARRRAGAPRGAPHARRRRLGHARPLPGDRRAALRRRRAGVPLGRRAVSRRGRPARPPRRRGGRARGARRPGARRAARRLDGGVADPRRRALARRATRRRLGGAGSPALGGARGRRPGAAHGRGPRHARRGRGRARPHPLGHLGRAPRRVARRGRRATRRGDRRARSPRPDHRRC